MFFFFRSNEQINLPFVLHEPIFRRSLSSSFDPFSAVPFSGQAILVVFGGSFRANARKKKNDPARVAALHKS